MELTNEKEDAFFSATIPVPSEGDVNEAIEQYQDAIDVYFNSYNLKSTFLHYYPDFDVSNEENVKIGNKLLVMSNYEVSALAGENIILFDEPVLLAEVQVSKLPIDETANNIRLISYGGLQKKSISKITDSRLIERPLQTFTISTFSIYDYVTGVILPRNAQFHSLKATSINSIVSNVDHLKGLQQAYEKLKQSSTESNLSWQASLSTAKDLLREGEQRLSIVKSEIEQLSIQKELTQNTFSTTKENVDSLKALEIETQDSIESKTAEVNELTNKSATIFLEVEQLSKSRKSIFDNLKNDRDELTEIRKELNEAKKQKLLSNYEAIAHTQEAGKQTLKYYGASALVFFALCRFVHYLYKNAVSFENLLPQLASKDLSSWDVLISRLPLVTATTLIIGTLSALLFFLIRQIVTLNKEKMTMLKAGILAQQMVSTLGLEGKTDEEIIQIRQDIQIKLITGVFDNHSEQVKGNSLKDLIALSKALKDS
ncbi:hypothetical protein AB4165_10395 [Vibrio cyclitrophicus]|uniref:hypothetical protein n=1 Tax=Vibrio cyclitrophicus TaxID=47951 RepID=UPI000C852F2A|nr:hypothetical protein [Vibrio cyclitrophicus]PMH47827.1 hypothetical protein BCU67_20280 [Vibrio cyclitrophicus]